jgi:hypothetical protein
MCDEPYIMVIDVNGDGRDDVYHHHCSGRDYLTFVPARQTLEHVNLGSFEIDDAPTLTSFWATATTGSTTSQLRACATRNLSARRRHPAYIHADRADQALTTGTTTGGRCKLGGVRGARARREMTVTTPPSNRAPSRWRESLAKPSHLTRTVI